MVMKCVVSQVLWHTTLWGCSKNWEFHLTKPGFDEEKYVNLIPNTQIPRTNSCQNKVAIIAKLIGSYGQSLIIHKVNGHLLLFISSFSQKTKFVFSPAGEDSSTNSVALELLHGIWPSPGLRKELFLRLRELRLRRSRLRRLLRKPQPQHGGQGWVDLRQGSLETLPSLTIEKRG